MYFEDLFPVLAITLFLSLIAVLLFKGSEELGIGKFLFLVFSFWFIGVGIAYWATKLVFWIA